MRKQFNLQDWLKNKSQRVETRDGRIVHNIWHVKEPLIVNGKRAEACTLIDGEEDALVFFEGGKYLPVNAESPFDPFIVTPEEERTPFEDRLAEIIVSSQGHCTFDACKDEAKRYAPELLMLAEKEIGLRAKQSALNELAGEHNEQMSNRREPSHFPTISTDEQEFLADEFEAFLRYYEKEFDDEAPLSEVVEHFFLCGKKWGEEKAMANLREALANNDIFRIPQWLRDALEKAYQKGKNATTHATHA